MKRRSKADPRAGTTHHAARGFVTLWATLMAVAKPNNKGTNAEIARELLESIDLDEKRKHEGKPHVL
jgi:hypothetical protein